MMMRTRQSMWPSVTPWNRRASSPRCPPSYIQRSPRPSPSGLSRLAAGSRPSSWPSSSFGGVALDSDRREVGTTGTFERPPGATRSHRVQPASPQELIVLLSMGLGVVVALAALVGPWFTVVTSRDVANTASVDYRGYGLFGYWATDTVPGMNATVNGNYLPWPSIRSALLSGQILSELTCVMRVAGLGAALIETAWAMRSRRLSVDVNAI